MAEIMQSEPTADQSEATACLLRPETHSGNLQGVEQHDTHGAMIFLAGSEAYKIKRAVRFPYMDFSTLELRKKMIEREFEINQPQAPELYICVVPITRDQAGGLHIGGTGTVVEWALHMRRFEQSALMGSIAHRNDLTPDLCRKLANVVRDCHQRAPRTPMLDGSGRISKIIDEVTEAFTSIRATLDSVTCEEFNARARAELSRAAECLDQRAREGHVRRCHGDLHLNNIVLWNGQPTLFDAIEFNDEIATIDTLYDLAFLLMDIDHRGLRREANLILNRYLWQSDTFLDLEGLIALPLFLGLRSAIRAMVKRNVLRSVRPISAPYSARRRGHI